MSSAHCDKNASDDDHLDAQTREFVDALDHGSFDIEDIDATIQNTGTLHVVDATLRNVGQRNALTQYAIRYGFTEAAISAGRTDAADSARITFHRRVDTTDAPTTVPDSSWRDTPIPVLPDGWSHRRDDGDDIFEHDDTDLTVTISKRHGRTMRHDDVQWTGRVRRGDGYGEPLTWGGTMSRAAIYATAAKFAAGTPDGDYDPEGHVPDRVSDRDRPRWPDVLGYDDAGADPSKWTQTEGGDA
jgi:hypothetical protein